MYSRLVFGEYYILSGNKVQLGQPRMSKVVQGQIQQLGPGNVDAHTYTIRDNLGCAKVDLGQMGHLEPGNHDTHRPYRGQHGMSKGVLG